MFPSLGAAGEYSGSRLFGSSRKLAHLSGDNDRIPASLLEHQWQTTPKSQRPK